MISILSASVLTASYAGYLPVFAESTHGFTLSAQGTAYDPHEQADVNVALTLAGTADGQLRTVVDLHVKGGDVSVQDYAIFSVSKGFGELVMPSQYIVLIIWVTPRYGGKVALWCMSGKTEALSGQTLLFSLYSDHVILPIQGTPRLDNLSLEGTITPIY